MDTVRDRHGFISLCIETWSYYNFLQRLEWRKSRDRMWMRGDPGKTSKDAKKYTTNSVIDLDELSRKPKRAYRTKIKVAITPFHFDEGTFPNVPSILKQTRALDQAESEAGKRLSLRALTRVRLDISNRQE